MRTHVRVRYDGMAEGCSQFHVHVRHARMGLAHPNQVGSPGKVAAFLDVAVAGRQLVVGRLEAGVIHDEVDAGMVQRRLLDVTRMIVLNAASGQRQSLMDAHQVHAELKNLLVERIHQLLVVHPEREFALALHHAGIELPGINLQFQGVAFCLLQEIREERRHQPMGEQTSRTCHSVDAGTAFHHFVGIEHVEEIRGHPADHRHLRIAVEEHLFYEVSKLQVALLRFHAGQFLVERRRELAEKQGFMAAGAHMMGLYVEHERVLGPQLRIGFQIGGFRRMHPKPGAEDLVHGEKGHRHPGTASEELPAGQAERPAAFAGPLPEQPLHAALFGCLRGRKILLVGNNLGGNGKRVARNPVVLVLFLPHKLETPFQSPMAAPAVFGSIAE